MTDDAERARALFATFPGIVVAPVPGRGSHVHVEGDHAVAALVFGNDAHGEAARLVVAFIFSRMGRGQRLDGKAPVTASAASACACATKGAVHYACTTGQLAVFLRALTYASAAPMGPPGPVVALAGTPLPFLLSRALAAFERDYEALPAQGQQPKPALGVWCNVLRGIGEEAIRQRDLPERTVLSRRGTRAVTRDLQRLGWLAVERQDGVPKLRLTDAGLLAHDAGPRFIAAGEAAWRDRFGKRRINALRGALVALTKQFEIELPWHLTGYGPADASVTGGSFVAAQPGPPRLPHHGEEWPVVLRKVGDDTAPLPLHALLSQALAQFTIDYEWDVEGYAAGLNFTTNLLRHIPDEGLPLGQAIELGHVRGNGKSGTERHLVTVVTPGRPSDKTRRVLLTPKGKAARDSFAHRLAQTQRDWRTRYGDCVANLRDALAALDDDLGPDLPDYPNTTAWFWHSMNAASHMARRNRA